MNDKMMNEKIENILKNTSLFQGLEDNQQREIIQNLNYDVSPIYKGEIIIHQDTPCNYLHVLLEGELDVNIQDAMGNNIKVEVLKGPKPFAIPHIFSGNDIFPATFTVKENGLLLKAPKENVFKLISNHPILLKNFLKERGNCNACTVQRLRILSYKTIRSRFIFYLIQHKVDNKTSILEHNQTQLAEYLNVSRPALASEIKKMVMERLILIDGNRVSLLDMNNLSTHI